MSETCKFCTDGNCLICQLSASTPSAYPSSSFGSFADGDPTYSKGSRRTPKKRGSDDAQGAHGGSSAHGNIREGRMCPICKRRYRDLFHHYTKKHPHLRASE